MTFRLNIFFTFILVFWLSKGYSKGDTSLSQPKDSFQLGGKIGVQLGASDFEHTIAHAGLRIIPALSYSKNLGKNRSLHLNVTANLNSFYWERQDITKQNFAMDLNRASVGYESDRLEITAGLQRLKFGSSAIMRTLQWFDTLDIRDPQKVSEGVTGLTGKYYISEKTSILIWALLENKFNSIYHQTSIKKPEIGFRFQFGRTAFSYNRKTSSEYLLPYSEKFHEHKFAFDTKKKGKVDLWLETEHIVNQMNLSFFKHQTTINPGIGVELNVGNGLNISVEQLLRVWYDYIFDIFYFVDNQISSLRIEYDVNDHNKIGLLSKFSWRKITMANYLNLQHDFNRLSLHLLANLNPRRDFTPLPTEYPFNNTNGFGIQLMAVYRIGQ